MDLDKLYSQDEDAAVDGKWLVTQEGLPVKVAKLGNKAFVAEVARLQKPHLAVLRSNSDNGDLLTKITIEAQAKTILKDWEVTKGKKKVPYTWQLGVEMLTKYDDFREDVSELSVSRANFKPEDISGK